MTQLETLHEDARIRFNERARQLLASVVSFREAALRPDDRFKPNVHQGPPVTDEDIVGDVKLGLSDNRGAPMGEVIAEIGGGRTGVIGDGYKALDSLAQAMAKVTPFKSAASLTFLKTHIFDWLIATRRAQTTQECMEFVLDALGKAFAEHRVFIPVSDLFVESPIQIGSVTIDTFPERFLTQLESATVPDGQSATEHAAFCKKMRSDFQGLAVAEAQVFAEPVRARERAAEDVEGALSVLRFFAPAHLNPKVVSRIARWGYVPQRTDAVFVSEAPSDRWSEIKTSLIDQPGTAVIDNETRAFLLDLGLSKVGEILAREQRSELEEALLAGMGLFGRAALTPDLRERLVWYCAGLESVLLRNSSEPILHTLSERLALFAYDTVHDRAAALDDVRTTYAVRSRFVHHGSDVQENETLSRFAGHGLKLFLRLIKNIERFATKDQLLDHIDRVKLSGT